VKNGTTRRKGNGRSKTAGKRQESYDVGKVPVREGRSGLRKKRELMACHVHRFGDIDKQKGSTQLFQHLRGEGGIHRTSRSSGGAAWRRVQGGGEFMRKSEGPTLYQLRGVGT